MPILVFSRPPDQFEKEQTIVFDIEGYIEKEQEAIILRYDLALDFTLYSEAVNNTTIHLTWEGTIPGTATYNIVRSDGSYRSTYTDLDGDMIEYYDEDVIPGKTYYYFITNQLGERISNTTIATTPYLARKPNYDHTFFLDLDIETDIRYNMSKFLDKNTDLITSYFLKDIKNLKTVGSYVVNEEHRPDLISYKLYKKTDFWWILLIYNNFTKITDIKSGITIYYPSIENLEDLYFSLKSKENIYKKKVGIS